MRGYRRLLNIYYKDHVTNEEVRNRIQNAIGVHDDLETMVKKRKLRWYGHISRSWRRQEIKEWMGMEFRDSLRAAEDREGWKDIVATSSVVPRRPPRLRDWDEMREIICSSDLYIPGALAPVFNYIQVFNLLCFQDISSCILWNISPIRHLDLLLNLLHYKLLLEVLNHNYKESHNIYIKDILNSK